MAEAAKTKKPAKRKTSALKRARQSQTRHARNETHENRMRRQIKLLRQAYASKNKEEAQKLLTPTLSLIAKMTTKGILHRNTAARYQSRLQKQFNVLSKTA